MNLIKIGQQTFPILTVLDDRGWESVVVEQDLDSRRLAWQMLPNVGYGRGATMDEAIVNCRTEIIERLNKRTREFRVKWEIDVNAESAEEAARNALELMNPDSIAHVFEVTDDLNPNVPVTVDLDLINSEKAETNVR